MMNKENQKKHEVCIFCDKQIKTNKSLTKSFWGYAHSRCHIKNVRKQIYIPCA